MVSSPFFIRLSPVLRCLVFKKLKKYTKMGNLFLPETMEASFLTHYLVD